MNETLSDRSKAAEKLWDLANIITGFAVVQSIATTFEVAKGGFASALTASADYFAALAGTIVFTLFYITAIVWCYKKASSHDPSIDLAIWKGVTFGRVAAVLLFTVVTLVAICGNWSKNPSLRSSKAATLRHQMR